MRLYPFLLSVLLISIVCNASLLDSGVITQGITNAVTSIINGTLSLLIDAINFFIAYNPEVGDAFVPLHTQVLRLLVPLYLLILTWNGIQIMTSGVVSNKANARIILQNSLVSMLLVASSLPIYKIIVNFSQFAASFFVASPLGEPTLASLSTAILFLFFILWSLSSFFYSS